MLGVGLSFYYYRVDLVNLVRRVVVFSFFFALVPHVSLYLFLFGMDGKGKKGDNH